MPPPIGNETVRVIFWESPNSFALSPVRKILRIQDVIDKEVRPRLEHDGGSIELIDLAGTTVKVRLKGVCATCPNATLTLRKLVQAKLNEFLSPDLVVEEA